MNERNAIEACVRASRRGGFLLDTPIENCFHLFTPEGEKQWAEGWTYDRISPLEGPEEEGLIFRTHDARGLEMIWRIQRLDFPTNASYYVVTTGSHVTEVNVALKAVDSGKTHVEVEYVYVPFSSAGVDYVETVTEDAYRERMLHWKRSIDKR